jgi:DNA-binding XRE family transcriptional regulator
MINTRAGSLGTCRKHFGATIQKLETLDLHDAGMERRRRAEGRSAERLKAKRLSLGLTQMQMAQLLGISSLSQWKWESGQVTPRASMLQPCFEVMRLSKREALKRLEAKQSTSHTEWLRFIREVDLGRPRPPPG